VTVSDPGKWLLPAMLVLIFGYSTVARGGLSLNFLSVAWLVGVVVIDVNMVLVALRTRRGLTLAAAGITWHGSELFLPWSSVADLEIGGVLKGRGTGGAPDRLVVKVTEISHATEGQRGLSRVTMQANQQRYGGPVAISVAKLRVPVDEIIATAGRLQRQYMEAGGYDAFADVAAQARRHRALTAMNVGNAAGFIGLVSGLAITFLR
jgi:hypothetical protein